LDSNDRWFNNPQFRLSVKKKTQVIISLMQEDEKTSKKSYIPVNFMVVRSKSKRDRLWEVDRDDVHMEAADGMQRFAQREITMTTWLLPEHDKKKIHYIIVPNTVEEKKTEERPFFLRIFSSEPVELSQLPPNIELAFNGKWNAEDRGGRLYIDQRENQFWCRNPQYFMNITKPTHLKIILRKKGGKKARGVPIGLTIAKALAPTCPPASQIRKPNENNGFKGSAGRSTVKGKTTM
jgi:hypothetical protein